MNDLVFMQMFYGQNDFCKIERGFVFLEVDFIRE